MVVLELRLQRAVQPVHDATCGGEEPDDPPPRHLPCSGKAGVGLCRNCQTESWLQPHIQVSGPGTTEASLSSLHQMQAPFWTMLRPPWAAHSPSSLQPRSFLKIIDLHHYPSRHAHDLELCLGITLRLGSVPMVSTTASCLLHLHPLTPAL